jgi:hypothetical protein
MTQTELEQLAGYCAKALDWDQQRRAKEVQHCAEKWLQQ